MVNHDSDPTVPYNLVTSTKPSVSNIRVLFFPCVVQKSTAHVSRKTLNMNNKSPKQLGYLHWNSIKPNRVTNISI